MKIYLDACAINRLTDNRTQPRMVAEAMAMENIFNLILIGTAEWVASASLRRELSRNPDRVRRYDALMLMSYASELRQLSQSVSRRAEVLTEAGYGPFDALHLAHAEAANVAALLTTDDRFMRKAARGEGNPEVLVVNPVNWLWR